MWESFRIPAKTVLRCFCSLAFLGTLGKTVGRHQKCEVLCNFEVGVSPTGESLRFVSFRLCGWTVWMEGGNEAQSLFPLQARASTFILEIPPPQRGGVQVTFVGIRGGVECK